jgi:hypothetical protein
MRFDEVQAQLAMKQNDGDVDAAMDDLFSGIFFAEPEEAATDAKRNSHQDGYDDKVAVEKCFHHPACASS